MHAWVKVFLFLGLALVSAEKNQQLDAEQNILLKMFENYDPSVRPPGKNGSGPVMVEVNTYVRSITNIDDVKMEYSTQLTFRQKWQDSRLQYNAGQLRYVTLTRPEKIWIPDLFFSNEMTGHFHNIIMPNNLIRIFPDGTVLFSTRVSLKLHCPMDLKNYPMDNQICDIRCASYGYTTEDVVFVWKDQDPVQMSKAIYLPKFTLNTFMTDYCTSKTNTGEYSCLKVEMLFHRDFTYYLVQAYMPTAALVLLSWVSFWLNPKNSIVRLGIWIGILLAMVIVTTSIGARSPQVSYIKALDVWMGVCVFFIFCVLIELCAVSNAVKDDSHTDDERNTCVEEHAKDGRLTSFKSTPLKWLNKYSTRALRIDAASRFLFPATFALFNFIYWITYAAK